MKKKSFLSGIGAKLALAAVALTTVVFTSCEKEEFNVEPIELSPASATIVATVYDLTTAEVLAPKQLLKQSLQVQMEQCSYYKRKLVCPLSAMQNICQ